MPIETATYVDSLVVTNPTAEDPVSEGDNHIRMLKQVLKSTFPGLGIFGGLSNALDTAQGDAYIAVKQPHSGSITRTQHDKNSDLISVKDFGAVGNGIVDDTTKFTAASVHNAVFVPPGSYVVTSNIVGSFFSAGGVTILGGGSVNIVDVSAPVSGVTAHTDSLTITVGPGGDVSTINAALIQLQNKHLNFKNPNIIATIHLLAGFTMTEQVQVRGVDFSWVKITAANPLVDIDGTAFVANIPYFFSSVKPAFSAVFGGSLPQIACKFTVSIGVPDMCGIAVCGVSSSVSLIEVSGITNVPYIAVLAIAGGLVQGFGTDVSGATIGLAAWDGSVIEAGGAVATACNIGVNAVGSFVSVPEIDVSSATSIGISAEQGSFINANNCQAAACVTHGAYAVSGSTINAHNGTFTGTGERLRADSGSRINACFANCTGGSIVVANGSVIAANASTGALSQTENTITAAGIIFK